MDLILAPKNMPSVTGNFEKYKEDLIKQIETYKSMPLTDETVGKVKSSIRQIRTTLEKIEDTAVGAYFDSPKKALRASFAELYAIIADGESKVDEILAENDRKRNAETTERLTKYINSKIKGMAVEKDAVDYVLLKKNFYNKTAKEADTLNDIDLQLTCLEKNFAAYIRAEKKINKLAETTGAVFDKLRYLHSLSKYADGNDEVAAQAEEEAERINNIPPEEKQPVKKAVSSVNSMASLSVQEENVSIETTFPAFDKKKSKGAEEIEVTFTVPKELKKSFTALLKELKEIGITSKK